MLQLAGLCGNYLLGTTEHLKHRVTDRLGENVFGAPELERSRDKELRGCRKAIVSPEFLWDEDLALVPYGTSGACLVWLVGLWEPAGTSYSPEIPEGHQED